MITPKLQKKLDKAVIWVLERHKKGDWDLAYTVMLAHWHFKLNQQHLLRLVRERLQEQAKERKAKRVGVRKP